MYMYVLISFLTFVKREKRTVIKKQLHISWREKILRIMTQQMVLTSERL